MKAFAQGKCLEKVKRGQLQHCINNLVRYYPIFKLKKRFFIYVLEKIV